MPRRDLRFATLSDVLRDIHDLQTKGYERTANWDLSQVSDHLADWMTFPIDGFPSMPWFVRWMLGVMRVVQGKSLLKKFIQSQRMATGQPTVPSTVHTSTQDSARSIERLQNAIRRLELHRGPIHPSPLFGAMSYDELIGLQLAHCAHHLSFLIPK
jgi:Protein of unknown function (DUF1569)